MKKIKKMLASILSVFLIVSVVPVTASAAVYTGKCGDNLTYSFDESTGTLTISGTGDMYNYAFGASYVEECLWEDYDKKL